MIDRTRETRLWRYGRFAEGDKRKPRDVVKGDEFSVDAGIVGRARLDDGEKAKGDSLSGSRGAVEVSGEEGRVQGTYSSFGGNATVYIGRQEGSPRTADTDTRGDGTVRRSEVERQNDLIGGDDTYSRYKIKKPIAPPDYGGTAIVEPKPDEIIENVETFEEVENAEKPEEIEDVQVENGETVQSEQEMPKKEGLSIDDLTLDDLLFMGAAALLMSGRMGDESMLLLSYLLTCGL